jgi:hypothetical protein
MGMDDLEPGQRLVVPLNTRLSAATLVSSM